MRFINFKTSKLIFCLSLSFFANKNIHAQWATPTDQDNFNSTGSWTIVDPSCVDGKIKISSGTLNFSNAENTGCPANSFLGVKNSDSNPNKDPRIYRKIKDAANNPVTLSNTNWTTECKFRITNGNGPGHFLIALTSNTLNPQQKSITIPPYGPDGEPNPNAGETSTSQTNQDGIFASLIAFGLNQEPSADNDKTFVTANQTWDQTHMGSTTDPVNMGWRIFGHAKNGTGAIYPANLGDEVAASNTSSPTFNYSRGITLPSMNIDYYLRLERLNKTTCKISVFKDAAMTDAVLGSPQCFIIDSNIVGLNTIQNSSFHSGNPFRSLSGNIDDIKIYNAINPTTLNANISVNTQFCQGTQITATGSATGNLSNQVQHYGWAIEECTQNNILVTPGASIPFVWDPVNAQGNPIPLGAYTFPGSENLPCNKYYRVTLAVQNLTECLPWQVTSQVIFIACKPTPEITTGGADICLGSSWTLCSNYMPSSTYQTYWGMPKSLNKQCITVTPSASGQYPYTLTVTNLTTGCSGQTTAIVNVYNNNPSFSYNVNTSNPSYNTIGVIGNDANASSAPGFGEQWFIDEINPTTGTTIQSTYPQNPYCWWVFPTTNYFNGFNNLNVVGPMNVDCINGPTPGHFDKTKTYRITRGTWNSACTWAQASSTISPQMLRTSNNSMTGSSVSDNTTDYSNARSLFTKLNNTTSTGKLTVFPNPTNGLVSLNLKNALDGKYSIEVFDVFGKLIYKDDVFNMTGAEFNTEINLSSLNLSNGLYLINVNSENQKSSQRVVIEK